MLEKEHLFYFKQEILRKAGGLDDGLHQISVSLYTGVTPSSVPVTTLRSIMKSEVLDQLPTSISVLQYSVKSSRGTHSISLTFSLKICPNCSEEPHRYTKIIHNGKRIKIDCELAPLILGMWEAGIETEKSCQECPEGLFYIFLPDIEHFKRFMYIVYEVGGENEHELDKEFPNAISSFYTDEIGWSCEHRSLDYPLRSPWKYTIEPHYTRPEEGIPTLTFPIKLEMPRDQIHDLAVHFEKYNRELSYDEDD